MKFNIPMLTAFLLLWGAALAPAQAPEGFKEVKLGESAWGGRGHQSGVFFNRTGDAATYYRSPPDDPKKTIVVTLRIGPDGPEKTVSETYDQVHISGFGFMKDQKTVYYWARLGNVTFPVVGGKKGPELEGLDERAFSRRGTYGDSYYVTVLSGPAQHLIVDGKYLGDIGRAGGVTVWNPPSGGTPMMTVRVQVDGRMKVWKVVRDGSLVEDKNLVDVVAVKTPPEGLPSFVMIRRAGKKMTVEWGDHKGPSFDSITRVTVNPISGVLTYVGTTGDKTWFVSNGKKGPACDRIGSTVTSADGRVTGYVATQDRESFVVVGSKKGKKYSYIGTLVLVLSPDGKKVAYVATKDGKRIIVIGSKEMYRTDNPFGQMRFSPDGRRLAYLVSSGKERGIWVDGKLLIHASPVRSFGFSSDGKTVIADVTTAEGHMLIINEKARRCTQISQVRSPFLRGQSYLITGPSEGGGGPESVFVIDGVVGKGFEPAANPKYCVLKDGSFAHIGKIGGKTYLFKGGDSSGPFDDVRFLSQPGSELVIAGVRSGTDWFLIVGDEPPQPSKAGSLLATSPDGKRRAFIFIEDRGYNVLVGDTVRRAGNMPKNARFSPDGRYLAFGASDKDGVWWRVIDLGE